MTENEQDWLAELGFSEEDEVWPPRRGPTAKELQTIYNRYTRTGIDGEALKPSALRELWGSGVLSVWCDQLEVSRKRTQQCPASWLSDIARLSLLIKRLSAVGR